MKEHVFTLILTADPNDDDADRLYGAIDDATISTIAGEPKLDFHRTAKSLEEAIRTAISDVRGAGFEVERIQMEPAMV